MSIHYDPFSHEAMQDPFPLYKQMRDDSPVHFMPEYNAWAFTRFEDVWKASLMQEGVTFTAGQTPGQVLLGEQVPHTFMTMDAPEHREWRGLIRQEYTPEGVELHMARFRALVKELLQPLLAKGGFDVYADLANRATTINAGYMLGMPREGAEQARAWIDGMLHRAEGQKGGGSEVNQQSFGALFGYLFGFIAELRQNPENAVRHTKAYMEAEINGKKLSDEELCFYLFSLLVTGSETTPITVSGTLYNLAQNPASLAEVRQNPALLRQAFLETVRYDQPTNMLARKAKQDFELGGQSIREGQGLLFIYSSACRDEREFEQPDVWNLHRDSKRTLIFGHGGHKCLGMHLGTAMGTIILEEIFAAIPDFEVDVDAAERLYGEHLSGFGKMPIRFQAQ